MSSSGSEDISGSDSDSSSENGVQHASASAGPSAAADMFARGRPLQRQVNATQTRGSYRNDLQIRLALIQREYGNPSPAYIPTSRISSGQSRTSSMAVSVLSQSITPSSVSSDRYSTASTPSLSRSAWTQSSGSSLRTVGTNSNFALAYRLRQGDEEIAELSEDESEDVDESNVRLECAFGFLRCPHIFRNLEQWDRHNRAHYRGNLPAVARCPFSGCPWSQSAAHSGHDVYEHRLRHMQEEHEEEDFRYTRRKPDAATLDQLRRNGLISSLQYQELRRDGQLGEQAVLNTASSGREAYRRRRS